MRARLHADAARWVESESEGRQIAVAEILAFHYREAAMLYTALEPGSEVTTTTRSQAAKWLLKAADVAVAAAATPEAVHHLRASFEFVDPKFLPRLHERIGDLTAGDSGLEEYRLALEGYQAQHAPGDDQLRARERAGGEGWIFDGGQRLGASAADGGGADQLRGQARPVRAPGRALGGGVDVVPDGRPRDGGARLGADGVAADAGAGAVSGSTS